MGTLALIGAWLLLQFLGRHGRNMGSRLAATLRRPVLFGLGISLYASWIIHQLNERLELGLLAQAEVNRISTTLVIASITWAVMNIGQTVLRSASMRRWIRIEDQQDESMLINVMSRLFTIAVLLVATAALMITFGSIRCHRHHARRRRHRYLIRNPTDQPELSLGLHVVLQSPIQRR